MRTHVITVLEDVFRDGKHCESSHTPGEEDERVDVDGNTVGEELADLCVGQLDQGQKGR